jgi:hypothetical protein
MSLLQEPIEVLDAVEGSTYIQQVEIDKES